MGLFDVFKSKEQKELDKTMEDWNAILFPNGEIDIVRDAKRVHLLLQGKLSMDECRACVGGGKTLIYTSEDKSAEHIVPSIVRTNNNKITEKEAYSIYAYLSGEALCLDKLNRMGMGDNGELAKIFQNSIDADELPNGYGEYGYAITNPIPTISVSGSEDYLSRLRFNGQPITYERLGSTHSDVTTCSIDIYSILCSGKSLGDIYICPYHRRNSKNHLKDLHL